MIEIKVPDIGDFESVEVIDILVAVGDTVEANQDIITLESDKAAMEIPTTVAGVITDLKIAVGDSVAEGTVILELKAIDTKSTTSNDAPEAEQNEPVKPDASTAITSDTSDADMHAEVLVLGSGPGGYTAAFRAADLGKKVIMLERHSRIGGVCLNVGCIPSKALLHIAQVINEAKEVEECGVTLGEPTIDIFKIKDYKDGIITKLTSGLSALAKQRKVTILQGEASFASSNSMKLVTDEGTKTISFDSCIIAAGSRVTQVPIFPNDDSRMMDSTDALNLAEIPDNLLVIGGGIIGLEMATVYNALGSSIDVVELQSSLIAGADKDIVKPLLKKIEKEYDNIFLKTKVAKIEPLDEGLKVYFDNSAGGSAPESKTYDKILVAVGRTPNGKLINAESAGVNVDDYGFINVNKQMQTNVPNIYAIGDIVGQPMLAHKAVHEGKVAAEVISGHKSSFDPMTIPSVAYTDPEIAWMGVTETEAKAQGLNYIKGAFPWAASGRSLSIGRDEGLTKALFDKETGRIIGASIVGTNAGELIAEAVLALEMGADAEDIGMSIHPHPTLSETLCFAAEMAEGTITDLIPPRKTLHSK